MSGATCAERRCPSCTATASQIREVGHAWMTRTTDWHGRQVRAPSRPVPIGHPGALPCPEACSCIPECFSMAEHEARDRSPDQPRTPAPTVPAGPQASPATAKQAVLATLIADLRGKGVDPVPIAVLWALEVAYDMGEMLQRIRAASAAAVTHARAAGLPS